MYIVDVSTQWSGNKGMKVIQFGIDSASGGGKCNLTAPIEGDVNMLTFAGGQANNTIQTTHDTASEIRTAGSGLRIRAHRRTEKWNLFRKSLSFDWAASAPCIQASQYVTRMVFQTKVHPEQCQIVFRVHSVLNLLFIDFVGNQRLLFYFNAPLLLDIRNQKCLPKHNCWLILL